MRISNLSNKSGNPSSSDYFVLDDGTTVTKIDYNKLAKAIIENYAGSTVAGSAQSVKAALDSLNSKWSNITGVPSGTSPSVFIKTLLEGNQLPFNEVFIARISAGYYFFAIGHFYKVNNQVYGSAIVGRPNYMCKVNCNADTWTEATI